MRLRFEVAAPVRTDLAALRAFIDGAGLAALVGDGNLRGPGMLGLEGGWWYHGEYTAEPRGAGVVLVHRVFDVSGRGSTWAVPLANRLFVGYRRRLRHGIEELARQVERELAP